MSDKTIFCKNNKINYRYEPKNYESTVRIPSSINLECSVTLRKTERTIFLELISSGNTLKGPSKICKLGYLKHR